MDRTTRGPTSLCRHTTRELLLELRRTRNRTVRDELVHRHMPLLRSLCSRYTARGVDLDDLAQVAVIGLLKALDRFDPARGTAFVSFAVPTVLGELRRHFRDHGWSVRVPRGLQEMRRRADEARESLAQGLGRLPTMQEIAADLGVSVDEVVLALDGIRSCFRPDPLGPTHPEPIDEGAPFAEHVVQADVVHGALEALPHREQTIVVLRFWGELTQQEIADRVGISQMHVSRLLRASLDRLRTVLTEGVDVSDRRDAGIRSMPPTGGHHELAVAS